jgi:hypothetical protein
MPAKKSSSAEAKTRTAKNLKDTAAKDPKECAAATDPFLGHVRAVTIVCGCAKTIPANLARTLDELGVNGIPFQQSVRNAVRAAGYTIGADDVPGAACTRLVQVVTIIQNARRAV